MADPIIPLHPDTVYHIYNHANGEENIFRCDENYAYFLKKYREYIYPIADTYAYCLMPNHFHLMIKIRSEEEVLAYLQLKKPSLQGFETLGGFSSAISKVFSNLFNGYAQAFNKMYQRKGSLFIPNFKRKPVYRQEYFSHLIAYIHLNPVKHGFCKHILDWPHSSMHAYYEKKNTKINRQYLYESFNDKAKLIDFHNSIDGRDLVFDF